MENISTRTWIIVGLMGLALFVSQWTRVLAKRSAWGPNSASYSYEMPRPQNYEPEFSLSGREVQREFVTLPALPTLTNPAVAGVKVDPKKEAEAKKKLAAQKAAAEAAKKAAAAARKKTVQMNVVNTNRDSAPLTERQNEQVADTQAPAGPAKTEDQDQNKIQNNAALGNGNEEDLTMTPSQWRALLQSSPTQQNAAKFARAKAAGKIDVTVYYQIIHELLTDSADDRRRAAQYIVDQDVTPRTYEFLVSEVASAPVDAKLRIQKAMDNYAQASRASVLIRVMMASKTRAAVESASAQLTKAFQDFKQVYVATQDPGQTRRLAGGFSLQQFISLVASLKRVSADTSNPAAGQASQLMTDIQNLQNQKS